MEVCNPEDLNKHKTSIYYKFNNICSQNQLASMYYKLNNISQTSIYDILKQRVARRTSDMKRLIEPENSNLSV